MKAQAPPFEGKIIQSRRAFRRANLIVGFQFDIFRNQHSFEFLCKVLKQFEELMLEFWSTKTSKL